MLRSAVVAALVVAAAADFPGPRHTINLDLEPSQRWADFTKTYAARANVTLAYLRKMVGPGTVLHPVVESLRKAVLSGGGWTAEHLAEMQGIADVGGFDVEDIQLANLFYEFGTLGAGDPTNAAKACTSIVAQLANGTIVHARNQDYSLPGLSDITVQVDFARSGKVVYSGNTFAGYIGLPTAMRPGGWSVSCDSRFNGQGWNLLANINTAKKGGKTIGILVREMLESASTFDEAVAALNSTSVIAPAYYIVAGAKAGEGAVVTRNRDSPDNSHNNEGIWRLTDNSTYPGTGRWWRLETNWDHWLKDGLTDGRRVAANKMMGAMGQDNADLASLFGLLSTKPVLASDTVYTSLMCPAQGLYDTTIREH